MMKKTLRLASYVGISLPGHSCNSVILPTESRLVATNRHPGFSRMQRVPYLQVEILIRKQNNGKHAV